MKRPAGKKYKVEEEAGCSRVERHSGGEIYTRKHGRVTDQTYIYCLAMLPRFMSAVAKAAASRQDRRGRVASHHID